MRTCATCQETKELTEFHKNKRVVSGYHYSCKACRSSDAKERGHSWRIKAKYGLTTEQFEAMVAEQDGCCAICRNLTVKWHVDHNHNCCPTEKTCGDCVRALLCVGCNTALGYVERVGLDNVRDYLTKHTL